LTITDEQKQKIDAALRGNDADVITEGFNIGLTRAQYRRLSPCEWLDDEVRTGRADGY